MPAHYREAGMNLVKDLLNQKIIAYCGNSRSEWCAPTHFAKKPGRVPLVICLVLDFSHLNNCLIRDQPQVFPTGEEIRQQLCPECVVWVCMEALAAYFQIKVEREDQHNTTFISRGW